MKTTKLTKRRRRAERSRLHGMVLVGGAAGLSAIVVGMRRRSRRAAPTQAVPLREAMRKKSWSILHLSKRSGVSWGSSA